MAAALGEPVAVLLLGRGPEDRSAHWVDVIGSDESEATVRLIQHRLEGTARPGSLVDLAGGDEPGLVLVAEADAVPGPELLTRMLTRRRQTRDSAGETIVDARVLPVEVAEPSQEDGGAPALRISGACALLTVDVFRQVAEVWDEPVSADTGPRLVALADAAGASVVCEPTATVFRDVRVDEDGRVLEAHGPADAETSDPEPWVGTDLHPAALGATSLSTVLTSMGVQWSRREDGGDTLERPFLSIVTRTQGTRGQCLEDMFACLAGQTVRDFEVVLACHRVADEPLRQTHELVAALPAWLRERVRILEVDRPGRAAPLNEGFAAARGRYLAILDDDDTAFAHWVATFRTLEARAAGRVLRTVALRQDVVRLAGHERLCPVSVGGTLRDWPLTFELVDHLRANFSPCMTVAFPRGVFHDLGYRFDETLDTTEDWDFLVRAAAIVGSESAATITSLYRWWVDEHSSREEHDQDVWDESRHRVLAGFDRQIVLLPAGSASRLREAVEEGWREASEVSAAYHHVLADLRATSAARDQAVDLSRAAEGTADEALERAETARQRLARRTSRQRKRIALLREAHELARSDPAWADGSLFDLSLPDLREFVATRRVASNRASPRSRGWFRMDRA